MSDESSTTRKDAIEAHNESLMRCYHCNGTRDTGCAGYREYKSIIDNAKKREDRS